MQKHVHGGDVYSHRDCLDFSANCNPLGTPENVRKAVCDSLDHIKEYPQVGYRPLREAIGQYEDVSPEHIICGNGAAELVFSLCQAVRPKKALIPVPTFAEYEQALSSVGCEVEHVLLKEDDDFAMQETFIDWIHKDLDMVFLCNPNNPTGMLMDQGFLFRVLRVCREQEILLVLDECFLDFVEKGRKYTMKAQLSRYHNLFILKAFTKRYAMPGVRLGYGITENTELLEKMTEATQPWNISVMAQAAGIAALKETEYVEAGREIIFRENPWIKEQMTALGLKVFPTKANYIFFKGPAGLYEATLEQKVIIRNCGNYPGLKEGFYRVAVRTHEENEILIKALKAALLQIAENSGKKNLEGEQKNG